jgi:hypothetical protein
MMTFSLSASSLLIPNSTLLILRIYSLAETLNMESLESKLSNLPPALRPVYTTPEINQPILLYEGSLEITQNEQTIQGEGRICFEWFPRAGIRFQFNSDHASDFFVSLDPAKLTLVDASATTDISLTNYSVGQTLSASGWIEKQLEIGSDQNLAYVLCHIVNFHDCLGSQCAAFKSESSWTALQRHVLGAERWQLTLDQLETTAKHVKQLDAQGGFAITHVAKLERSDSQKFAGKDAVEFLNLCGNFFSFARGFRVPIMLLAGYDKNQAKSWKYWAPRSCQSWCPTVSWLPKHRHSALSEVFPGFFQLWREWSDLANIVLNEYLESNAGGRFAEHSILLAQIALEMIAWTLLVEKESVISKEGFDKLPASDKLRLLLSKLGIPREIPPSCYDCQPPYSQRDASSLLPNLFQLAKDSQLKWVDGPHALTELRNGIAHPKKLQRVLGANHEARCEARRLGLWYLELVLLALMNYQGCYANRLIIPRHEGTNDRVPWSDQ